MKFCLGNMANKFVAPCSERYGCDNNLSLYSKDGPVEFLECDDCGLIWRDLTKCDEEREYDEEYFNKMGYKENREHKVSKAHMLFEIIEEWACPGKMLEVGPGFGYNMEAAKNRGWRVKGLDVSPYISSALRVQGLPTAEGSLTDLRNLDKDYSLIFMKHVLEHYRNPFEALANARDMLEDGGLIAVIVPNSDYIKAKRKRGRYKFYSHSKNGIEHFVYFNQETLREILEFSDFEILQEGFPVFVEGVNSPVSILSRTIRECMAKLNLNQEIFALARKKC